MKTNLRWVEAAQACNLRAKEASPSMYVRASGIFMCSSSMQRQFYMQQQGGALFLCPSFPPPAVLGTFGTHAAPNSCRNKEGRDIQQKVLLMLNGDLRS